jgi:hypothetical protein
MKIIYFKVVELPRGKFGFFTSENPNELKQDLSNREPDIPFDSDIQMREYLVKLGDNFKTI